MPTADLDVIEEGQAVVIASGGDSGKQGDGRISFISPLVNPGYRSARVIALDRQQGIDLAPWRGRDRRIVTRKSLWKSGSRAALQTIGGEHVVFVRTPNGFQRRTVTTGRSDEQTVEIVWPFRRRTDRRQEHIPAQGGAWQRRSRGRGLASEIVTNDRARSFLFGSPALARRAADLCAAAFGGWSMTKLLIDAVPDITNKQVQINTIAPALSPTDIEKQVTYPLETAFAGIPGLEYTRSFSRNGFSLKSRCLRR